MKFLKYIWTGITRNFTNSKEQEDFDCVMITLHVIPGLICTVILATLTPLGFYAIGTIVATIILVVFWMTADIKDYLAAGYFFAATLLSFAWVLYVPITLIVFVFGFPIFYSKVKNKKYNAIQTMNIDAIPVTKTGDGKRIKRTKK